MTEIWHRIRRRHRPDPEGTLTCREVVELVTAYLENALSTAEQRRFKEHLGGCSGCAGYLNQIRETIAVTGRVDLDDLPDASRAELLSAFRGWPRDRGAGA